MLRENEKGMIGIMADRRYVKQRIEDIDKKIDDLKSQGELDKVSQYEGKKEELKSDFQQSCDTEIKETINAVKAFKKAISKTKEPDQIEDLKKDMSTFESKLVEIKSELEELGLSTALIDEYENSKDDKGRMNEEQEGKQQDGDEQNENDSNNNSEKEDEKEEKPQEDRKNLIDFFKELLAKLKQILGIKSKVESEIARRPELDVDKLNEEEVEEQNEDLEEKLKTAVEEKQETEENQQETEGNQQETEENQQETEENQQETEEKQQETEEEQQEIEENQHQTEEEQQEIEEEQETEEQKIENEEKEPKETIVGRFKRLIGAYAKVQVDLAKVEIQLKKRDLGNWIDDKKEQAKIAIENAKESLKNSKVGQAAKTVRNKVVEGANAVIGVAGKVKDGVVNGAKTAGTIVIGAGALTAEAIENAKDTVKQAGQQTIQNVVNTGRDTANSLLDKLAENVQRKETRLLEKQQSLDNSQQKNIRESEPEMGM